MWLIHRILRQEELHVFKTVWRRLFSCIFHRGKKSMRCALMFSSEPVQSKFLFCWLRQGKSRQYKRFPQRWQLFNHQKQVLDLKDRPWDGKPYTINNLPRPLFLPLQGHVMARTIDWGNPACHRTHARSGGTQVLQEYAQHLIPAWNRRQQAEKGELAFAVLSQRSQKHCSHYLPVYSSFYTARATHQGFSSAQVQH